MKIQAIHWIVRLIPICMLIASLSSCNSMMKAMTTEKVKKLGVYDESLPEDELTTLLIPTFYTVNQFNGQKVNWKGTGWVTTASMIKIPAGNNVIAYKYKKQSGGVSTKEEIRGNRRVMATYYTPYIKDEFEQELTMELKAGKIYIIERKEIRILNNTARFSNLE